MFISRWLSKAKETRNLVLCSYFLHVRAEWVRGQCAVVESAVAVILQIIVFLLAKCAAAHPTTSVNCLLSVRCRYPL